MITLQYVRECQGGFECRLFDFDNDITLTRPTLVQLEDVVRWLVDELNQPGRTLEMYREQKQRIESCFANPSRLLPKGNVSVETVAMEVAR